MKVKDMLLQESSEEKRQADAQAVEAFGGHLAEPKMCIRDRYC